MWRVQRRAAANDRVPANGDAGSRILFELGRVGREADEVAPETGVCLHDDAAA